MKRLIALSVCAGALAAAAPALAYTTYNPATGQTYVTSSAPSPVNGAFDVITMPIRMVVGPFGQMFTPANGGIGPVSGDLVPTNPRCGVITDIEGGRHTAVCDAF